MKKMLALILITPALIVLSSCTSGSSSEDESTAVTAKGEELQLPPVDGLPDYAYRSASALQGYQIAVLEKDLLAKLPCYCGCGQDPRFQNLRDCFLNETGDFNSHGANCEVCQEEAVDTITWKRQGMSTKGIRERIDKAYEGRGKPTDTPPVEG